MYELLHKRTPFESHEVFMMGTDHKRPKLTFKKGVS